MKTFPMFLRMEGRHVVIVGGSEEAARKIRLIARTEAAILILAGELVPELAGLGRLAALAGRLRGEVERNLPKERRRGFWSWAFSGAPRAAHAAGDEAGLLAAAIRSGGGEGEAQGSIALVGAGPGAADLLTLRALQRMQEADVIFHDRQVDRAVLELARRDAERVFVGKEVGAHSWPQEWINRVIVDAGLRGLRVVRLKSGDPGIFGRAAEELAAARAAGIPAEIVPGVTAAVASLRRLLTEWGETDHLVIATGTCRPGDDPPDWGALLRPGTTLALYMAMGRLAKVAASLRAAGLPEATGIEIVTEASTGRERQLSTTLARLAGDVAQAGLRGPAIIFIRRPKQAAGRAAAYRPAPLFARIA
ncbi:uroporphyrinogen-III C-methyltransferase [Paenirhodobacter sp.]|uniref:uroporphyrinogen-III C-methyltransferase n=1 Tax=Paenirhodobacter sp. TaxID=1965326 RepID=UPI003B3C32FD